MKIKSDQAVERQTRFRDGHDTALHYLSSSANSQSSPATWLQRASPDSGVPLPTKRYLPTDGDARRHSFRRQLSFTTRHPTPMTDDRANIECPLHVVRPMTQWYGEQKFDFSRFSTNNRTRLISCRPSHSPRFCDQTAEVRLGSSRSCLTFIGFDDIIFFKHVPVRSAGNDVNARVG